VSTPGAIASVLDLLPRLGVFVKRDFLEPGVRDDLRSQMEVSRSRKSPVGTQQGPVKVVEARNSRLVDMPSSADDVLLERLEAVRPEVESAMRDRYTALRPPQWLLYGEGNFHKPHQDWYDEPNWERRISLLTFLNGESADSDPDSFAGGQLVLYGPLGENRGIPISGEPGLLIGFRANTVHEVRPVTRGRRYAVLSWFTV
jgi:predicted 2-oxoglutarate/Fe(II)-dependent dioxygenase YbiX